MRSRPAGVLNPAPEKALKRRKCNMFLQRGMRLKMIASRWMVPALSKDALVFLGHAVGSGCRGGLGARIVVEKFESCLIHTV